MANLIFETYLNNKASRIDDYLESFFMRDCHPDMERYLYGPLEAYTANGGKRHRPLICLLACRAVGGSEEDAMSAAAAIEHFHTAALIHDDIADTAQLRRGKPCLHITEGIGLAVNDGDLALSQVTGTVLDDDTLDDATKIRVLKELVDMTTHTIEGQALDIGWTRDERFDVTIEDYLVMANHKTAYYSGSIPLVVGAIIGGGSEEQIDVLRSLGMSTGLAFQLQDDLLNLVGSEEAAGKDFRSDITEGKRTMVAVHALAHTSGAERDELLSILSAKTSDPERLEHAVQIMESAGSIDYVRDYANKLAHDSQDELKRVLPPSTAREQLMSMADFFVSRLN